MLDFNKIKEVAQGYQADMTAFLRAIVKNPGESCDEKAHVETIAAEMKKLDFDEVVIDPQGNVIGYMGTGDKIIAFDGHIDTVGIGNINNWTFDPYDGYENETEIGGRGVSDQCGGVVSAVYGAKIMKDYNLIPEGYKIMVVGSVQEEDCDGLCWQYIINEDKVRPEFVVSTEPTDGGIYRGQRGRMEIRVDVKGVSCHGSAPERGDNAIYKVLDDIAWFRDYRFEKESPLLGPVKMSVTVINAGTQHNVIPDKCTFIVDVRSNELYSNEELFAEIKKHISCEAQARSFRLNSSRIDEKHPFVQKAVKQGRVPFGSPTFGGNPVCCSAALATIKYMLENDIPGVCKKKGEFLKAGLEKLAAKYPEVISEVRGTGLMLAVEFHTSDIGYECAKGLFARRVMTAGTLVNAKTIRFEPTAVISQQDMEDVLTRMDESLADTKKAMNL